MSEIAGEYDPDEAGLQRRTYAMLDERLRMQSDRNFLEHYLSVAQHHAREHQLAAAATNNSVMEQHHMFSSLMDALHHHQTDLAVESAALRQSEMARRKKEDAFGRLDQRLRGELTALREQLAVEKKAANAAAQHAGMVERQFEEERRNTSIEAVGARDASRRREVAEDAHRHATNEAAERDELAAVTVQQSLAKIEEDFAQERAVHQARGRSHQHRLKELEELFGGGTRNAQQSMGSGIGNERVGHSMGRLRGSPFALSHSLASNSALVDPFGAVTSEPVLHEPLARESRPAPPRLPDSAATTTANITNTIPANLSGMPSSGCNQPPTPAANQGASAAVSRAVVNAHLFDIAAAPTAAAMALLDLPVMNRPTPPNQLELALPMA